MSKIPSATTSHSTTTTTGDAASLPGSAEQAARFQPQADAIAAADVHPPKVEIGLAIFNGCRGAQSILDRQADAVALPGFSLDAVTTLPQLGTALQYRTTQLERLTPTTSEVNALILEVHQRRAALLAKAEVLVVDGVVSDAVVEAIRKGRGPVDAARDCIALSELFHDHADAAAGRVVVTATDIHDADDAGTRLLALLHPANGHRTASPEQRAASDARDRMWTLFEQTWERHVWRAGAWLFGRAAMADYVPVLGARVHARKPAAPAPAPAPVPPPTTATPDTRR